MENQTGSSRYPRLRVANAALALLHAGQAAVILALSNDFGLPVTGAFLDGPPGVTDLPPPSSLFDVPLGYAVAAFLLLAAVDHALVAAPGIVRWYERNLDRGINVARWAEYSLSASLMVVLIAMLTGISDVAALVAILGVNVTMILCGWLMEHVNTEGPPTNWRPFLVGCVAGIVPWAAIAIAIVGSEIRHGGPPGFVYGIFVSLFVLFFSFAANQALQFARIGRFRNYRFGEWGYLVLSLVAKSVLAWQVFANTLLT